MRIPRDLTGQELIKALGKLGYEVTRQSGSHIRLTPLHATVRTASPLRTIGRSRSARWLGYWVMSRLIIK
jgi:predicted RNA binding protein YcfA (HicA-like mRNA interferase family)